MHLRLSRDASGPCHSHRATSIVMAVLIGLVSISVCPSFAAPHDGVKAHDASKTMELAGRRAGIGRFKRQLASAADELKLFLGLSASERVTEPDPDTSELSTRAVVKLAYPPSTGRPPSRKWTWTLGPYRIVPNKVDAKYSNFYHVTPDCFVPVIPSSTGSGWVQFWSESSNYRTTSTLSPFFEDAQRVDPNHLVFGGAYNGKGYDNGG